MTTGERFADVATGYVGVPFWPHGRDPKVALDCVGVIWCALAAIGIQAEDFAYELREGVDLYPLLTQGLAKVFQPASGDLMAGDVLTWNFGAWRGHCGVYTDSAMLPDGSHYDGPAFIHAAGSDPINAVILTPLDPGLKRRIASVWRLS